MALEREINILWILDIPKVIITVRAMMSRSARNNNRLYQKPILNVTAYSFDPEPGFTVVAYLYVKLSAHLNHKH